MADKLSVLMGKSVLNRYVDAEPIIRRWAEEVSDLEQRVEGLELAMNYIHRRLPNAYADLVGEGLIAQQEEA